MQLQMQLALLRYGRGNDAVRANPANFQTLPYDTGHPRRRP